MFLLSLQKVLAIQERGLQFVQFSAILFLGHYVLLFDKVCCFWFSLSWRNDSLFVKVIQFYRNYGHDHYWYICTLASIANSEKEHYFKILTFLTFLRVYRDDL